MRKTMRYGKVYWSTPYGQEDEVHERLKAVDGDARLYPGEVAFVAQLVEESARDGFSISDKQMTWIDAILARCGRQPLVGAL